MNWISRITAAATVAGLLTAPASAIDSRQTKATPYLSQIVEHLDNSNPAGRDRLWFFSARNKLEEGWLLQTPACWGEDCDPSNAEAFLDAIRTDIGRAKYAVDLLTMMPVPNGSFQQAIKDGLRLAALHGHSPVVRVFLGAMPLVAKLPGAPSAKAYLKSLTEDIPEMSARPRVAVAYATTQWPTSWSHAKALAVDGVSVITGGHNLWEDIYATASPVSDLSMRLSGDGAFRTHQFADLLWSHVCSRTTGWLDYIFSVHYAADHTLEDCPSSITLPSVASIGDVPVIALGGAGLGLDVPTGGFFDPNDPASISRAVSFDALPVDDFVDADLFSDDVAAEMVSEEPEEFSWSHYPAVDRAGMTGLLSTARKSIFLSQMELLGLESRQDPEIFNVLAKKLLDGIPVTIVLSSRAAHIGVSVYSWGWKLTTVLSDLVNKVSDVGAIDRDAATRVVCQRLKLAPIRRMNADRWPDGSRFANHAKLVAVDHRAFYIGSTNLYPSRLAEWGFIVEDRAASKQLLDGYIRPLWHYSRKAALVDYTTGLCPKA